MNKKMTYLDTGLFFIAYQGNHELFEKVYELLNDPDREYVVSDYLKFELFPKAIFFKNDNELGFYQNFFSKASVNVRESHEIWDAAYQLACVHGLSAMDSFHACSAISVSADELITKEKPSKALFRIPEATIKVTSIHS